MLTAKQVINLLKLKPLPIEGGYFRETYRSTQKLPGTDRALNTAIYYLLTPDNVSAMHRLPTDEIYHFYLGGPVRMLQLLADGEGRVEMLGSNIALGQKVQLVVPAGTWQGSCMAARGSFALLGTTMAPGFDFTDYEPAKRADLLARYPDFEEMIQRLCVEAAPKAASP